VCARGVFSMGARVSESEGSGMENVVLAYPMLDCEGTCNSTAGADCLSVDVVFVYSEST
jgi:hypothetical protein